MLEKNNACALFPFLFFPQVNKVANKEKSRNDRDYDKAGSQNDPNGITARRMFLDGDIIEQRIAHNKHPDAT
jgi:hypothetical protein